MKHFAQPSILTIALLATALWWSSCQPQSADNPDATAPIAAQAESQSSDKVQAVEVVHPAPRSFNAEVEITGTAMPNQKVMVYAVESGYVQRIAKEIGDYIRKGEVIASLANPEVTRKLAEMEVLLEGKKSTYDRLQSIYDKTPQLTPLQALEDARTAYLSQKAVVEAIQDRVRYLQVRAPFSGRVTQRLVDQGALVQSGLSEDNPQGIVELQETNPIRLVVPMPESDLAGTRVGMEVQVIFPELQGANLTAKVSRTAGALDPGSKTMQVEIDLPNAEGKIIPGMYAKVRMQLGSRSGALSLPVTAQTMVQNQPCVLLVKDQQVERIPLRKGLSNKDFFEVLNPELDANSMVIVQGKGLVKPGQMVKPVLKGDQ